MKQSATFALVAGIILAAVVIWAVLFTGPGPIETPPPADVPSTGALGDM